MNKAALVIADPESEHVVRTVLEAAGYACTPFASTAALLRGLRRNDHSLVVVDIDTREASWQAVLDRRNNWLHSALAVILVGSADMGTAAMALDAGADDFVAKPVGSAEFRARLHLATRRQREPSAAQQVSCAGCVVDLATSSLKSERSQVGLTAREMAIAQLMFEQAGRMVSRRRLAMDVWGCDEELTGRSIEQHIYQLRRKLRRCVGDALALRGVYGSGYRLDVVAR